mmetsp:Transcript_6368/g.15365  ORF Transcript_6368/g.15365 Transcript_6368/m.15365 type:complete len:165 (+) Transcript_6368:142-636(+)
MLSIHLVIAGLLSSCCLPAASGSLDVPETALETEDASVTGSCGSSGSSLVQGKMRRSRQLDMEHRYTTVTTTMFYIYPINESVSTTLFNESADHDCVMLDWSPWGDCILPTDDTGYHSRYQVRERIVMQHATAHGAACNETEQVRFCEYSGAVATSQDTTTTVA